MKKFIVTISLGLISSVSHAAQSVQLNDSDPSVLNSFVIVKNKPHVSFAAQAKAEASSNNRNELHEVNKTELLGKTYTRYQQYYNGIKIFGAEAIISSGDDEPNTVSGEIIKNLETLDYSLLSNSNQEEIRILINNEFTNTILGAHKWKTNITKIEPVIFIEDDKQILAYEVVLEADLENNVPKLLHYIIDAKNHTIIKKWNDIKAATYRDTGLGGNVKTGQYTYGKDGIPNLEVTNLGNARCRLATDRLRVVDLKHISEDSSSAKITPIDYNCGKSNDYINQSYGPMNDAMFLGNKVYEMYSGWYNVKLGNEFKRYRQLVLRVHLGNNYSNAYWDPRTETMNFGDGDSTTYSFATSIDVMAHEISHGITQYHSNLVYDGQPGALNESFSDMAGATAGQYLSKTVNPLFVKLYQGDSNAWLIGFSIVKLSFGSDGFRYMDQPSRDNLSADCYDRKVATAVGEPCYRTYGDVLADAKVYDPDNSGGFLVHTASGVFNKAFYLLSQKIGAQDAFRIALTAQYSSWTPYTNFANAACAMKKIAVKNAKLTRNDADLIFGRVGIDTKLCN
jgi:vibriolysin